MGLLSRLFGFLSRPFRRGGALLALASSTAALSAGPSAPLSVAAEVDARRELASAIEAWREPSARNLFEWSPALIRTAETQADTGDLAYAAQLCEWLMGDERVATCASTRIQALLGAPVSFDKGRGKAARAAVRALEADEDWWKLVPEAEQARILEWGLLLGVALVYRQPGPAPVLGGRDVPEFVAWSPRWLRYRDGVPFVRVAAPGGGLQEVEATRANGFHLFTPYGSRRPWSRGLWRGLARLCLIKSYALADFPRHSEIHGNPAWVAKPIAGQSIPAHRKDLGASLASLGRESVIVLPAGYELELVEAKAKTWEMFVAQIKLANDSIAIAWLGGNLLTDAGDGATTGATAQAANAGRKLCADEAVWTTWAHDEILTWWAVVNFGSAAVAPWPNYDVDPPADAESEARALKGLGEAGAALDAWLRPHGLRTKAADVCEAYAVGVEPLPAATAAPSAAPDGLPAGLAPPGAAGLAAVIPIASARGRARKVPWRAVS